MPHKIIPATTLLAALGLLTLAPLTHADEGAPPAAPDTDQAIDESLETEDALGEFEIGQNPPTPVQIEVLPEPAAESVEVEVEIITETTDPADIQAEPAAESRIISMDRSDWPTLIVSPIDGKVTHHPHFTGEAPLGDDIVTPLHAPDPVWQLQEALAGAHAGNLNGENLSHLGSQPIVGLTQFVLMPARMILENPWSKETSP